MVKERPILFSPVMAKSIVDNCKTQTRRAIKPQPLPCDHKVCEEYEGHPIPTGFFDMGDGQWACRTCGNGVRLTKNDAVGIKCPYGVVGDRLWVREAWKTYQESDTGYCAVKYKAGGDMEITSDVKIDKSVMPTEHWRHAMFMPRWASRIMLEITEVRVQRLQDISNEDARAEGVDASPHRGATCGFFETGIDQCFGCSYRILWNQINGKSGNGWDTNPFCWVVSFRRVDG